jgi:acyl-coenzyme A thioesterase PaaI-like protein
MVGRDSESVRERSHRARQPNQSMMSEKSLQEKYAPNSTCWGCGPANLEGLHIRSFVKNGEVVAEWKPQKKYEAYAGALNGGVIGTLLDCHCNWTAAYHLMKRATAAHPPRTVTAEYAVKFLKPASTSASVFLSAKVLDITDDRATVEGTLSAGEKVCATCRGVFVAVKEGHPAYHRW